MPVNAPMEYFKAEEKFNQAKNKADKIAALEEMIRLMPRHHGSENALAQLKARLAKLKKEGEKKGARKIGLKKEGDAQICILGVTNSGKSTLLRKVTGAKPKVSSTPYTTTKPQVGMMDYCGVKVQLVEIPATFEPEYMSIARGCDAIIITGDDEEVKKVMKNSFIRQKSIKLSADDYNLKGKIWNTLGLMVVYTKKTKTAMSLPIGASVKDFASKIHKDFIKDFRFARIQRKGRLIQAGLKYKLQNNDIVELYMG